jgi:hypothetical protein
VENTVFWINQEFSIIKNGKPQKRGKINLIGRLQLSTERSQQEDNQSIVQLRILRTQEAIIKIMKMRKRMTNAALQVSRLINFPQISNANFCNVLGRAHRDLEEHVSSLEKDDQGTARMVNRTKVFGTRRW